MKNHLQVPNILCQISCPVKVVSYGKIGDLELQKRPESSTGVLLYSILIHSRLIKDRNGELHLNITRDSEAWQEVYIKITWYHGSYSIHAGNWADNSGPRSPFGASRRFYGHNRCIFTAASEGWGKVLFSVCQFTLWRGRPHLVDRGDPIPGLDGGVPHPRSGQGGYPIPGLDGGTLSCWWGGGVPHPRSGQGGTPSCWWSGGYPSKIRMEVLQGTPRQQDGVPSHPGLDGVTPPQPSAGWGIPRPAGGVPLAFTQEDFRV